MGTVVLIMIIIIVILLSRTNKVQTSDGYKTESEIIQDLFYSKVEKYEAMYKDYSRMEIIKYKNDNNNRYYEYWNSAVEKYNNINYEHPIKFYNFDLYGNEQFLDDDTQADLLIATYYDVEFIAEYRAMNNIYNKIMDVDKNEIVEYKGVKYERSDISLEYRAEEVLCTKQRLNQLITDKSINPAIYTAFSNIKDGNSEEFYKNHISIFLEYPGINTYLFNYLLYNLNNYDDPYKGTLIAEYLIDYIADDYEYNSFWEIDFYYLFSNDWNENARSEVIDIFQKLLDIMDNDKANEDFIVRSTGDRLDNEWAGELISLILCAPKNNIEMLELMIEKEETLSNLKQAYPDDVYELCKNNNYEMLNLFLQYYDNFEQLKTQELTVKEDFSPLDDNDRIVNPDDDFSEWHYAFPTKRVSYYEAIIKSKTINNKIKKCIKEYNKQHI